MKVTKEILEGIGFKKIHSNTKGLERLQFVGNVESENKCPMVTVGRHGLCEGETWRYFPSSGMEVSLSPVMDLSELADTICKEWMWYGEVKRSRQLRELLDDE